MLRKRLIPRILVKRYKDNFVAVVSKQFEQFITIGQPESQFRILQDNNSDEISIVNLHRQDPSSKMKFLKLLESIVEVSSTPITSGGGIEKLADVDYFMSTGVEKICIPILNDASNISIINYACKVYGSQSVQVTLDYMCAYDSFILRKSVSRLSTLDLLELLDKYFINGAGEIVVTDTQKDGSKTGLNMSLISPIKQRFNLPVIVSGGANNQSDFTKAFNLGADGVISGTYFAKTDRSLLQIRSAISTDGISVRKIN